MPVVRECYDGGACRAEPLVEELVAKIKFLLDMVGYSEEGTFTFPDGDTWRKDD